MTVGRGRQAGVTPNLLIAHLEKIAPPPVLLHEPSPPLASVNNQLMLKELKCSVSSNILSQPLELQCGALVCTKCFQEWIAASGAVNCPCCSEGGLLVSFHVRPAPGVILLLLSAVLVHCTDCSRDVKAGDYDGHECVPTLTPEEEKQALGLLKEAISTSPDKGIIQLATPNSVYNTCAFSCFATGDSIINLLVAFDHFKDQDSTLAYIAKFQVTRWQHLYPFEGTDHQCYISSGSEINLIFELNTMQVCPPGLHIMLGIFTKMFHWLEALCCQLDLELASHTTDFDSINFSKYSQDSKGFHCSKKTLKLHSQEEGSNICGLSSWRGKPSCCGSFEAIWCFISTK
eukprot:Em0010g518a